MIFANQIAGLVALLAILLACLLLHIRLRGYWSLSFLISIGAIATWAFWGSNSLDRVLFSSTANDDIAALAALGRSRAISAATEAVLMLWFSVSFLFAIKSIRPQRVA